MTETSDVMAWGVQLLKSDSELRGLVGAVGGYDSLAPQTVKPPYVILSLSSYTEAGRGIAGDLGAGVGVLVAKAVTSEAGFASAEAIYKRVHAVLHRASGVQGDTTIRGCEREGVLRYTEVKDGIRYNHLGGTYRLFVSGS